MDETEVIGGESRWPLFSRHVEKDESDDSGPSLAEVKDHQRDDQEDQDNKPGSSVAELRGGESSSPPAEAKGDHSDSEHEEETEISGLPPNTPSAEPPSTRSANQDIDTEYNRMSSLGDISTMKMAVESGSPKAVDDLMERLSDTLTVDELTTTYGGGDIWNEADKDNLFRGTSPILHAARSGNLAVFKSVMKAMEAKLSREQVKEMLADKDIWRQSLLSLAARSGRKDVLEGVILVIQREFTECEVTYMLAERDRNGHSLLDMAARSGSKDVLEHVLGVIRRELSENEDVLGGDDRAAVSLLASAVRSGSMDVVEHVFFVIRQEFFQDEVNEILHSADYSGASLPACAALSGNINVFMTVLNLATDKLADDKVKQIISSRASCGESLLSCAVESESVEILKAVMVVVVDHLLEEEVLDLLCEKDRFGRTPLGTAIRHGNLGMCEIILRSNQDYLGHTRMQVALDAAFLSWKESYEEHHQRNTTDKRTFSKIVSMLLRHSARPPAEFLQWTARDDTDGKENLWPIVTESLLIGVESASNPLVPGMNLSVPLAEAAEGAREGEQRRIISLQKRVDEYMLEVLERLPQTIQGFDEGITQCSALFEPEGPRNGLCGRPGPLRVAFERRQQMESLCAVPLVMDYLSRRFTNGLPDMRDSGRVLGDETALSRLADDDVGGLVLGYTQDSFLRYFLQGAKADTPSLTVLPGAQFIIAGLLAKPNIYYRVPAMRMAMDCVVYIMMLYFYSFWVLLHEDGPLSLGEIFFSFYVLAGVFTEVAKIKRSLSIYLQDPWNFFDALALVMLAGGFLVRLTDGGSPWGRALYALSAPLVFSRILFFVQILQFQGPMIQVMFSMGMVLLQFGVILLVVMMGFAMALYPLLRDTVSFTFSAILLLLFKTLLGDVGAFEEFDESTHNRHSTVGRLILTVYLVVMTVMLLNLLIAVLSTRHTKVDVNADKEFKVSRARIIEHYRLAVAFNILPAPFNLWQLVLTLPFLLKGKSETTAYTKTMEEVGKVSFWLVLSPLFVAGGVLLWVTSSMYNICRTTHSLLSVRITLENTAGFLFNDIGLLFWCALGAPLSLLALWLRQSFIFIYNGVIPSAIRRSQGERGDSNSSVSYGHHKKSEANVHGMLEAVGVGASDLRKYLEDPMCDPKVRPDEVERGTTVKHMKLLRDRLEKKLEKFNERVDHLDKKFSEHVDHLENKFNERVDQLDKKFSEHVDHLGEELNKRVDHLGKEFNERVDSLEKNTNALASETNIKVGLVLEILGGK